MFLRGVLGAAVEDAEGEEITLPVERRRQPQRREGVDHLPGLDPYIFDRSVAGDRAVRMFDENHRLVARVGEFGALLRIFGQLYLDHPALAGGVDRIARSEGEAVAVRFDRFAPLVRALQQPGIGNGPADLCLAGGGEGKPVEKLPVDFRIDGVVVDPIRVGISDVLPVVGGTEGQQGPLWCTSIRSVGETLSQFSSWLN